MCPVAFITMQCKLGIVSVHYSAHCVVGSHRKLAVIGTAPSWLPVQPYVCFIVWLHPIRILAGAPESVVKILVFYSGLLGHCQDTYVTTILPSRFTSHSIPRNWCSY